MLILLSTRPREARLHDAARELQVNLQFSDYPGPRVPAVQIAMLACAIPRHLIAFGVLLA